MQLITTGIEHHREKRVPACMVDLARVVPDVSEPTRLKMLLLHSGSGVLSEGDGDEALVSPMVALIGRQDGVRLSLDASARGRLFLFHPQYLNDELSFEALADFPQLSRTGREDRFLIRHFLDVKTPRNRAVQLEAYFAHQLECLFQHPAAA